MQTVVRTTNRHAARMANRLAYRYRSYYATWQHLLVMGAWWITMIALTLGAAMTLHSYILFLHGTNKTQVMQPSELLFNYSSPNATTDSPILQRQAHQVMTT